MKVQHVKPLGKEHFPKIKGKKACYRTEVTNTNKVPIKIVWYNYSSLKDECWLGYNVLNKVLREKEFLAWYCDSENNDPNFKDGWLLPGKTAACDPNWNSATPDNFKIGKWSFIAVDSEGNTYFDEAEVKPENCEFVVNEEQAEQV